MANAPTRNRITFADNPWPNGHAIKDFAWFGRLEPSTGVWFHFHLETENYYAEDGGRNYNVNETATPDWQCKTVWNNYHSCTISSTYWGGDGFCVASKDRPLDFDTLTAQEYLADPLPIEFLDHWPWVKENESRAFSIYLLGHDMCADHFIRFSDRLDADSFAIAWRGRIAHTYGGDREFRHTFNAPEICAQFGGVFLPDDTAERDALRLLSPFVASTTGLRLTEEEGQLVFKLR